MSSPRRVKYKINKANTELLTTMNAYLIKSNKKAATKLWPLRENNCEKEFYEHLGRSVNTKKLCLPLV